MKISVVQVMQEREQDGLELTDYYFMEFQDGNLFSKLEPIPNHFAERFIEHHDMKRINLSFNGRDAYLYKEKNK